MIDNDFELIYWPGQKKVNNKRSKIYSILKSSRYSMRSISSPGLTCGWWLAVAGRTPEYGYILYNNRVEAGLGHFSDISSLGFYEISPANAVLKRVYSTGQYFGRQKYRKSDLLPESLSAEKFCQPKILSNEKFCPIRYTELNSVLYLLKISKKWLKFRRKINADIL